MKAMIYKLTMVFLTLATTIARAEEPDAEAEIRKAVEAYVVAFNQGDAKAVASMWSPEAVYINPMTDDRVVGRVEIEKQMADTFANVEGIQLEAISTSIQLISPGVAVEHGTAKLSQADQALENSEYTAIYVKREGQWLLDRMTEEEIVTPPSNYEHLKELEWMVGNWIDSDDKAAIVTECKWSRNNNFLIRTYELHVRDRIDMSGMQIIGWDPSASKIRSWVFDSDGSFGQGTWTKSANRWSVQQSGLLADGRKTSSVNIFTLLDESSFTLQSVDRTVDGNLLPNVNEVKITKEITQ